MQQANMYICHPFRGKCKIYNNPETECNHAKPHRAKKEVDGYCYDERDPICGGICRKIIKKTELLKTPSVGKQESPRKLKTCPFCGGKSEKHPSSDYPNYNVVYHKEGCWFYEDPIPYNFTLVSNYDIKSWNKRVDTKTQKLYVVTMYRYADKESHSYVIGVFTDKKVAIKAAEAEKQYRGGNKYYPEILEFISDNIKSRRIILPLGI